MHERYAYIGACIFAYICKPVHMCAGTKACVYMREGGWWELGVFLSHFPPYILRRVSHLNPELAPGTLLPVPAQSWHCNQLSVPTWVLRGCWGSKLWSLYLHSKCHHRAIAPSLYCLFFNIDPSIFGYIWWESGLWLEHAARTAWAFCVMNWGWWALDLATSCWVLCTDYVSVFSPRSEGKEVLLGSNCEKFNKVANQLL